MLLSSSPEQSGKQTTLFADRLRLNLNWSRFRVGVRFELLFGLRFQVSLQFNRMLLVSFLLRLLFGLIWRLH